MSFRHIRQADSGRGILGDKQSRPILILGGLSAIALAYARVCAVEGRALVLVGRHAERLSQAASDLEARGAAFAAVEIADLADLDAIATVWETICNAHGLPEEILVAYGVLGDMDETKANVGVLRRHLETNFVSVALWLEIAAEAMETAGRGRIVVIGSVAGDRGRQSNYPYGAAKGALERYTEGLAHRFALGGRQVSVHLIKPGFVETPMTDGLSRGGPLWAEPPQVARAMRGAVLAGRRVAYVPWFWRFVMLLIRSVPAFVLHKTRL